MRSLPIAWEIADTKNPKPITVETHPYLFESESGNNEPVDFDVAASKRLEPIEITAQAPFCYGNFGFDGIAERTREQLKLIPTNRLRRIAAKEFAKRFHSKKSKNPERSANIYLRETIERVKQITDRSPLTIRELNSKKHRKEKAEQLALISQQICIVDFDESTTLEDAEQLVFACYIKVHDFALSQGVTPPYGTTFNAAKSERRYGAWVPCDTDKLANKLEYGVRRMTCEKWWMRKLTRLRDMTLEHLNITMGLVNKRVSPYASKDAVREFKHAKRSQSEWVKSMQLESENGDLISLEEVFKGSVANPEIRRIELMVRLRGYEEWAEQNGLIAMFYTITAPSKYHAVSKKYNNASPRETQAYLVNQWAKARSAIARDDMPMFGMRVTEPHADATPHWHMLVFMNKRNEKAITSILKTYALEDDPFEDGAQKNRFDAEYIDPSKGSAVGYIAKYISKNINVNHIEGEIDLETGEAFTQEDGLALNVGAWASRWRIRQFQFFGGAPVGLWREFRRIKPESVEKLTELAKGIFDAADNSRFAEFMELIGGAFAKRESRTAKVAVESDGANDYGEEKRRTVGISTCSYVFITRNTRWALRKDGSPSPWSTGNNCTQRTDNRQIHAAGEFDPLLFIPPEIAGAVRNGAVYHEVDEELKQIKEFKFTSSGLSQSTAFY
ncbi:replication endonuclease [Pseudoalteromonas sp. MMG005]|uniref:replication endonuclease n=1 Tax=Pseudoalteromonas sp. MMG005 TaxID=2822682 RepID=UPI001B3A1437|nr:replication endonuclease [Pseudoalteromonas sp. MMG005]MBQ4844401.1 replication endonuclease [Pseudoalteromonas sp. MMG005]